MRVADEGETDLVHFRISPPDCVNVSHAALISTTSRFTEWSFRQVGSEKKHEIPFAGLPANSRWIDYRFLVLARFDSRDPCTVMSEGRGILLQNSC